MELGEFIQKSVERIVQSIFEVTKRHPEVNGENQGLYGELGHLLPAGQYGVFTRVDFDLAVLPSPKDAVGGRNEVWVSGHGKATGGTEVASRIAFSVPIRLPDAERSPASPSKSI